MKSMSRQMLKDIAALFDSNGDWVTQIVIAPMSATLTRCALSNGKPFKTVNGEVALDTITIPVDPYVEGHRKPVQP